jgi:hypothetical protein
MALAALTLLAGAASAEELSRNVQDLSVIDDGAGASRILFSLEPLTDLRHVIIGEASLRFNLSGRQESRTLRLRVYPVITHWGAGAVSWTTPWSRAGGDFDPDLYSQAEIDLSGGARAAELDLTSLVKEIVEAGKVVDGFILTVDQAYGRGLSVQDLARFQGIRTGVAAIEFRTLPPRGERS